MSPRSKYWDIRGSDVPQELFPNGRVRISLGVHLEKYARPRRTQLQKLRRAGEWEVIRGIADGLLDVAEATRVMKGGAEDAAIAELRSRLATATEGLLPTVREEVNAYLEHLEGEVRPATVDHRRFALTSIAEVELESHGTIGELRVDRLDDETLRQAIRDLSTSGNTREGVRAAWSGLYTWSTAREARRAKLEHRRPRYEENPAKKIAPFPRQVRPETASDAQVKALLSAAAVYQEAYLRPLVQLGFRQSELRHTRLHEDLDTKTWEWRIQRRGPDPRCGCRACSGAGWRPKTKRSSRTLIVPEGRKIRSSIRRYLEIYPAEEGDFVFRRTDGTPWRRVSLTRDFTALCEAAGVKYGQKVPGGITLHTLRHTCATNLIRAGVDSSIVAAILGDAVETVVKLYVHLQPEDLARGAAKGPAW